MSLASALEVSKFGANEPLKQALGGLQTADTPMALQTDSTSTAGVTYIGKAAPGSATSSAVWQIQKMTTTGTNLATTWVNNGTFTAVWDNRTGLTYA